MNNRTRRPYEKKTISRRGAIIFGLGLGAIFATIAIAIALAMPLLSTRLETASLYARSYYKKMFPPPQYLPTPAPTVALEVAETQIELPTEEPIPTPSPTDEPLLSETEAVSAATGIDATTATTPDEITDSATDIQFPDSATEAQLTEPTNPIDLQPVESALQLTGFNHQWQTWNNCGPATVTTYMSYFGHTETQVDAALFLKPNKDDKNVSPYQLADYAESVGMESIVRQNGSLDQLKQFISNDIPVLVETWLVHDGDGLGHYRLVSGYNDDTRQLVTYDSLSGPDYPVGYDQFDADWRVFNRLYVVVFPPEKADLVAGIIGPNLEDGYMYEQLVALAEADIEANPNDQIAYFNKGEALTRLERYEEAAAAFDQARTIGLHWRRLWYQFSPFESYYAIGRYQDVLDLAEATIANSGGLEEVYYYKGLALHNLDQPGAEEAMQEALAYNPNFSAAQDAMETWSDTIAEP
ncbi:MAG: C39 family peptidase [Anaerolineae bacterium]|nr:C39 family peptidase [Anaerolineae bacterium]